MPDQYFTMPAIKKYIVAFCLAAALICSSCANQDKPAETTADIGSEVTSAGSVVSGAETTDMQAPETTDASAAVTDPDYDEEYINPLTGLACDKEVANKRPVAIMIDNVKVATPQEGISYADVMYECIVEGWLTRLMMVTTEYEELPVVGSVRSSREYFIDFAANHDAIYVHAGGSAQAYIEFAERGIDRLDGVNMHNLDGYFYRDSWRRANMGYEHSLMTTGEKITAAIEKMKYRTVTDDDFKSPLNFVPMGETKTPEEGDAAFLQVRYSSSHKPSFEYNAEEGVYYRFQYDGDRHIDNTAKVQLSFKNIFVLYLDTVSTNDAYLHMDVETEGEGTGDYLTNGKYETINWKKPNVDAPIELYDINGDPLLINRGKSFFQICTDAMYDTTVIQ